MPETALICRLFTARPGTPTHETGSMGLTPTATSFDFHRLERLPPSVFAEVTELMHTARRAARDIIDLGMGNPDLPTPRHIVAKIREVAENPKTHRYSSSRGIPHLRRAICEWYARKHAVTLDAEQQAITLIGAREGLAHFVLMMIGPGDIVLCLDPGYTIHQYSVTIAGGELHTLLLVSPCDFLASLERTAAGGQCRRLTGIGFGKAGGEARDAGARCAVSGAALKRRSTAYGAHAIVRITPTHVPCQRKAHAVAGRVNDAYLSQLLERLSKKRRTSIIKQSFSLSVSTLLLMPVSSFAAEPNPVEPETELLPTVTVRAQRIANEDPASLYATIATALRYDPEVDLQSRGLAEAQADVTVRGGVFENTALAIGAVAVHDPQTGHYTTLLPIDADVLSQPALLTGTAHALSGFNASIATLVYDWRALSEHGELALGAGSDALTFGAMAMADTRTDESGTVTGIEARYASASGDGSRPYGDHTFERALVHAQRRTRSAQTDVALAWQDSFFGWPGAYTGFASLPESDHTKTSLLIANHRLALASGAADTADSGDSWVAFGAYYRDLEDDYDFDRRTEESGTQGAFEHRTRSYAAAVSGRHAGARWAWRYALQVSADELVRSTDLIHGDFNARHYLKLTLAPERRWALVPGRFLKLRLGATLDTSNRDETAWLPLASLAVTDTSEAGSDTLKLGFQSSSQLPGYTALNSAPDGLFGGNADLGRERADSLSLTYERRRHDWLARIAAYARRDDDLVDWTYLSGAPFVRQANAVDLDVVGLEALITKEWPVADLTIGYGYLDKQADYGAATIDASYYALNYARHRLTAALRYALTDRTTFYFDNEVRRQVDNPLREGGTDAYIGSVALEWQPLADEKLALSLVVDNLTNSNFQEFPGTPAPLRQASLKLRYGW